MVSHVKIAGTMALIALTYLFIEAGLFVRTARLQLPDVFSNANMLLSHADTTITNIDATAGVLHDAAQAQASYWPKELKETQKVTAAAKELIVRTDQSVNGGPDSRGVLPQLTETLEGTNALGITAATALQETSRDLRPILANLLIASKGAADTMSDPDIPATVRDVKLSADNLASTTDSAKSSMKDVQTGVHYELGQLMKPVNKARVAAEETARLAGKFLGW